MPCFLSFLSPFFRVHDSIHSSYKNVLLCLWNPELASVAHDWENPQEYTCILRASKRVDGINQYRSQNFPLPASENGPVWTGSRHTRFIQREAPFKEGETAELGSFGCHNPESPNLGGSHVFLACQIHKFEMENVKKRSQSTPWRSMPKYFPSMDDLSLVAHGSRSLQGLLSANGGMFISGSTKSCLPHPNHHHHYFFLGPKGS